jgi:hypothetical protein
MLAVKPMAQPYLRLRQIALVARALEPVERQRPVSEHPIHRRA